MRTSWLLVKSPKNYLGAHHVIQRALLDTGMKNLDTQQLKVIVNDAEKALDDKDYAAKVINEFITGDKNGDSAKARPAATGLFYNRNDVLKALQQIQLTFKAKYVAGQKVNINTDEFKSALLNSMAKLENTAIPKSMNQIDGRTIDFAEMIFGAFLRDEHISDAVKTLLLRMQIPVIKTSLLDSNFFYNNEHPARHVLNTIAKLGIGIESSDSTIYQTVDLILEQLLRSFETNMVSFTTALASLNRLTGIENQKHQQNEAEAKKTILKEHARQVILTELQYHTMHMELPKAVQPLILNHWSTLMFHIYVRFGKDSSEWSEIVGILRLMTKTLKPIENENDWMSVNCLYKSIVSSVKSKLGESNQNKEKVYLAIKNLENTYLKALGSSEFAITDADERAPTSADMLNVLSEEDDENSPTQAKVEAAREKIKKLPEYVKTNSWFEVFTGETSAVRRLKLSMIVMDEARLVFVNRQGMNVIEKDAETFIAELESKRSRLIEDRLVFDHALSQVITSIASSK